MPFAAGLDLVKYRTSVGSAFKNALEIASVGDWQRFTTTIRTDAKVQNYPFLNAIPEMEEWQGEAIYKNLKVSDYSITNKLYQTSLSVDVEDIAYDTNGVLVPAFGRLAQVSAVHTQRKCFEQLTNGFTNTCFDGVAFFSDSHPNGDSTLDNNGGGSGDPWFLLDTTKGINPVIYQEHTPISLSAEIDPTADTVMRYNVFRYYARKRCGFGYGIPQTAYGSKQTLSSANFDSSVEAMMAFENAEGTPMGIMPNLLVVGPSNRAAALAILEAQNLASGASNTNYKAMQLIVSPFLA